MKNTTLTRCLTVGASAALLVTQLAAAGSPQEHLSLDAGWKFHLGDDWPGALHLDKAGASTGPASEKLFSDVAWRTVQLPHDWAIELPFDQSAAASHGFKALGPGFPTNSIGWYRRAFELPKQDAGKRIWLTFDGVFRDTTVWVNGWLVRRHEGGYYPFREDITDVVNVGGRNLVAVRVDATKFEGWFYEGAGIYRHVWLDKTAPVAIRADAIFVYSRFKDNVPANEAEIHVEASVFNALTNAATVVVNGEIVSPEGKPLARFGESQKLPRESEGAVKWELKLPSPLLWSPESPQLYKLIMTVAVGDKVIDGKETVFGIRTVAFDKDNGFLLNGKPYRIYGTCNHQDHAGVGAAIPDALHEFRIGKLKEFGCNAIRTSHNPPTPELLDACDRLGMLIMDESRLLGSDSENLRKWDVQVRRDRNHPSVVIWSVANEEFGVQSTPQGANVARSMQEYVKRLDPTRPVTYAAPEGDSAWGINGVIEVRGWNYHPGPAMDAYHAKYPHQPNVGTEQASVVGTRGIYTNDRQHGYVSAYDVVWPGWTTTAESWWSFFADRPWLSGGFVWTGFDYRGEPTPYGWPCINSHFGILDTCGFPKDSFYYYQAWWTTNFVLHLLPHWNWPGKEGQEIRVDALSNCKQVELFLNGASLGKRAMQSNSKVSWQVRFAPGALSARGFDEAGNVIRETRVETTGDATQIRLTPDRSSINADGEDVAVLTVAALDAQGCVVPLAQNTISFSIEGAGRILGVGNGDPSCHEPDTFVPNLPVRSVAITDWRWKLAKISRNSAAPEYANGFDDSTWNTLKTKADGGASQLTIKTADTTGIYRAHFTLTEEALRGGGVQARFAGCDDEGWFYVNNQFVGESHDWQAEPTFDIRKFLRAGDNVIAVAVNNAFGEGGLNPNVNVDIVGKARTVPWSRSLFNGLAQIIVQSTREAGEFKLTASADGVTPATAVVRTQPCPPRPFVP